MSAHDDWLNRHFEYREDPYEECPACDGDGLLRIHYSEGDPFVADDPCERCDGDGRVLTRDAELEQEKEAIAEDMAMDRYYHDKYGDE